MLLSQSRDCPIFNRDIGDTLEVNRMACQQSHLVGYRLCSDSKIHYTDSNATAAKVDINVSGRFVESQHLCISESQNDMMKSGVTAYQVRLVLRARNELEPTVKLLMKGDDRYEEVSWRMGCQLFDYQLLLRPTPLLQKAKVIRVEDKHAD